MFAASKQRISILLIAVVLMCFTVSESFCQEFSFREYGVRDGLPQSQAYILLQDSRDFLWISTKNGLSRFDGIDFVNYHIDDGLPSNYVSSAFEDSNGKLWVLTRPGLSEYNGERFVFHPPGSQFEGVAFSRQAGVTDKSGIVYLVAHLPGKVSDRIILFDNGAYSDYSSSHPALDSMNINSLYYYTLNSELLLTDSSGNLWLWKNETLLLLSSDNISDIHQVNGKVFLYSDSNLLEYRGGKIIPVGADPIKGMSQTRLSLSGQDVAREYLTGSGVVTMDLSFKASGVFTDRSGTVWLSSESNIYRLLSPAFGHWSNDALNITDPWALCEDRNGNIWLGSLYSDLLQYDGRRFIKRNDYKKAFRSEAFFYKGSRLLSNGETWLSTDRGVLIWDGTSFSRLESIPDNCQVCYIYEDPDNHNILIGTGDGLFVIDDGITNCFKQFTPDSLGITEGIVKDDSGFYWISGHNGLSRFDGISAVKVKDDILPQAFTYTIEKDRSGGIWVSSEEGLFFKGRKDMNFSHGIQKPLNEPANVVKMLDDSLLLVGRINDICLIDLNKFYRGEKDYYRVFDKTDGYPGGESLDNGIIKAKDGSVWTLTSENLVRFKPELLKKNPVAPLLNFTDLFYETDSLTWQPVSDAGFYYGIPSGIKLKRDQDNIKITFTGISMPNPEKVRYQYMLTGTNKKWSLPFSRREVIFRNLDPGDYSFMLRAINADGITTSEPLILNFNLKPSLHETLAFRISFLVLLVVFTVLITAYLGKRSRLIKSEKQRLKSELLKLQMQSVLKEFDHHFTFNAISSIGSLIMKNDRKAAYLYLTRLSALLRTSVRDRLELLKPISDELDFVRNYLELQKLRFGDRFDYIIEVGEGVDTRRDLPKMSIQTFVENAIKHGFENRNEGGKIEVLLIHEEECIKIIMRDNGIGRAESMKIRSGGTGYGVKTAYTIVDILNKHNRHKMSLGINDLEKEGKPAGTEVVMVIPDSFNFKIEGLFSSTEDIHYEPG